MAAYLIQWTCGNLKDLIVNHNQWVVGYLVVVGKKQQHVNTFFLSNLLANSFLFQSVDTQPLALVL